MSQSSYDMILIVQCGDAGLVSFLPDEHLFVCIGVERVAGGYRVELAGAARGCACPKCGVVSARVHARYLRQVRDLPVQGERLIVRVQARKFLCDNRFCARRIFCERFGSVVRPFARMTGRFEAALQTMALLVSAKAAERIGRALGYGASASTLLRCAHRYQPPAVLAGEIGVDDFAFKRGRSYGTIIVDLATNHPIELLRERSVESLSAYLEAHPMVRVVARDRDAAYAQAISLAAPDATVVADRWHLLRNLTEAFERLVANRSAAWRAALQAHHDAQHASDDTAAPPAAERNRSGSREQPAITARAARRQHLLARTTSEGRAGPRSPSPDTSSSTPRPSPSTSNATPHPTTPAASPHPPPSTSTTSTYEHAGATAAATPPTSPANSSTAATRAPHAPSDATCSTGATARTRPTTAPQPPHPA